jgi:hypothetical protein
LPSPALVVAAVVVAPLTLNDAASRIGEAVDGRTRFAARLGTAPMMCEPTMLEEARAPTGRSIPRVVASAHPNTPMPFQPLIAQSLARSRPGHRPF